ncbi:hypothetical protein GKZ68_04790 [Hymenobacter sp. BRD128]|uniref:hypothetical protein n=1 Tax=Hymenobacter sp. BRD128 TaxID=2675878 RepID=UPI0015677C0E|nr:hypothetical protein [Hymenobacter sp. BRD128]QKG56016.1 hypothetical protein GKZ68_04790 [Hymenobacter sp. BRD128]
MSVAPRSAPAISLVAHLRTFVRGTAGTGAAVAARTAGALLLSKLLALYGGPGGLTQLAQLQNLMALFGALPTDGVQLGATTYLAPLRPGSPRFGLWLGAAAWLIASLVGGAGLLLLLFGGPAWPAGRALVFAGAMLVITLQALVGVTLLVAGRRTGYVVLTTVLSALGPAAVAALLALGQPLSRVLLGYVVGQALTGGLALRLASRAGLLRGWPGRFWPSHVALRELTKFLLMALGNLLFGRVVEYAVRAYLMAHFAPSATDLWQAVVKLSDNYTLVAIAVLNTVFYPRLAALAAAPAEQRRYVGTVAGLLALVLAGGLGVLYVVRQPLLTWLFAPRLAAAAPLLAPQLLGDWAKFLSWVFQYTLLVRARPLAYLAMQAGGVMLYTSLLVNILPRLGLPGMVITHAVHYSLMLLISAAWFYFGQASGRQQ